MSVVETARRIRLLERIVEVLKEPDSTYGHWKSLVLRHGVQGRQVHDAHIVAVMAAYRVKRVITFNVQDFVRFPGIQARTPKELLQGP